MDKVSNAIVGIFNNVRKTITNETIFLTIIRVFDF